MEQLIKALFILLECGGSNASICCTDEAMFICGIKSEDVSDEVCESLLKLGFFTAESLSTGKREGRFMSTRYTRK